MQPKPAAAAASMFAMLLGCQAVPVDQQGLLLARSAAVKQEWTVRCVGDPFKAERRCFAGTFGTTTAGLEGGPFQVFYLNGSGPYVMAGLNTYPGREATVRVDDGAVIPAPDADRIVRALHSGQRAYVLYHVWPRGEERMTVDLAGFSTAYNRLRSQL